MDDWRNFNNVSFESIMVILYDEGMTIVIHPGREIIFPTAVPDPQYELICIQPIRAT